jgi:hypothetical protein
MHVRDSGSLGDATYLFCHGILLESQSTELALRSGPEIWPDTVIPPLALERGEDTGHTKSQDGMGGIDSARWERQNKAANLAKPGSDSGF